MTRDIFGHCLERFNNQMKLQNRKILLLLDNASGHGAIYNSEFPNVHIEYLPPNTTSHLQPMDAGIIRNLKLHYKKYLEYKIIEIFCLLFVNFRLYDNSNYDTKSSFTACVILKRVLCIISFLFHKHVSFIKIN